MASRQVKKPVRKKETVRSGVSLLTDHDIYLFKEGNHFGLYNKLGSHVMTVEGMTGTLFAVWAPNASRVSVKGDFNGWNKDTHKLTVRDDGSGIWEGFIPGTGHGTLYKYHVRSRYNNHEAEKGDPFAFSWETPPRTASIVWDLDNRWNDTAWMRDRHARNSLNAPITVYEMHPGSWRRVPEAGNRSLTYRETADYLPEYLQDIGFTPVEFLPVMEHPFYGSWGFQGKGFFPPPRPSGPPPGFLFLFAPLHQDGIGWLLALVPSPFPRRPPGRRGPGATAHTGRGWAGSHASVDRPRWAGWASTRSILIWRGWAKASATAGLVSS